MTTAATKSLEQRLYEAWRASRGILLTGEDLDKLLHDDAVGTRISNVASIEAGGIPIGDDCLGNPDIAPTWAKFVDSFREKS